MTASSRNTAPVSVKGRLGANKLMPILAAVAISFVGNAVVMGMPLMVGALADFLHFNEQQVGWLASADLGGMFMASVLTATLVSRINRRYLALIGIIIAVVANLMSVRFQTYEVLLAIRVLAGFGGGICYSVGIACLAITEQKGRNFSIMMFGLVAINAIELYSIPYLTQAWGINGIFVAFALSFMLCLLVIPALYPFIPEQSTERVNVAAGTVQLPLYLPWLCLLAVACFYITIGAFWAFIERAGAAVGLGSSFMANVLALSNVFTLAGCIFAVWVSRRTGQSWALLGALAVMTLLMLILVADISAVTFEIGTFGFCVAWLFTDIFQLGTLSHIDDSGRFAALVPAAQGIAQTIAPAIAGSLLGLQLGYRAVMILCAMGAFGALLCYAVVYSVLKVTAPKMADAE